MKGRRFNGKKRSTEDRRFISKTYGIKQNFTRYCPAGPSYTPAEGGAAYAGQKVRAAGKKTKIYRDLWSPAPGFWLDSWSVSYHSLWLELCEADHIVPILKRRKLKLSARLSHSLNIAYLRIVMPGFKAKWAWLQGQGASSAPPQWSLYASTDVRSPELRRKDENEADSANCPLPCYRYWEVAESGLFSRGTARFREVGRRARGALCQHSAPYSFSPPQHTSIYCWVWVQWTGMLDTEIKISFPLAVLFADHPAGSPSSLMPGSLLLAVRCLTAWAEVVSLVYPVPTHSSLEKQPPIACLSHCKMLYQY